MILTAEQRSTLLLGAAAAAPSEACGLIVGSLDPGDPTVALYPCDNVADRPEHEFQIAPLDVYKVAVEAQRAGLDVVGCWHSHPGGPASLSVRDLMHAASHNGWLMVLVVDDRILSWRVARAGAGAVPVEVPVRVEET